MYAARTSNHRARTAFGLYRCLLPRFEALRACFSSPLIADREFAEFRFNVAIVFQQTRIFLGQPCFTCENLFLRQTSFINFLMKRQKAHLHRQAR